MESKSTTSQNIQTVRKEIEDELRKSPDFQLYMLTAARHDRERMERLLEKLPAFRMWRRLSQAVDAPSQPIAIDEKFDLPEAMGLRSGSR